MKQGCFPKRSQEDNHARWHYPLTKRHLGYVYYISVIFPNISTKIGMLKEKKTALFISSVKFKIQVNPMVEKTA